jgi:maltose alpha-D-glucosyltransferase / alpha-amylase
MASGVAKHINVENQRRDPDSFLNWTASMIRLRKECPEIGWGSYAVLKTGVPGVLAMRYDWRGNSVLVLHNFAEQPHEVRLEIDDAGDRLSDLRREDEIIADEDGSLRIRLDALDYRWFRVGGLDYADSSRARSMVNRICASLLCAYARPPL